jgi:deoxyribodipyrimidine photo-lyase
LSDLNLLPAIGWDAQFPLWWQSGEQAAEAKLDRFLHEGLRHYAQGRDRPDKQLISMLSPHLHFGEISVRRIWYAVKNHCLIDGSCQNGADAYLRELGFREFAYHLLYHFPQTTNEPMYYQYKDFPWESDERLLSLWQQGKTGYPIVDAGMRQLWAIGWMHNRVRMVVASFLVKDLLMSWQHGAKWFWDTLVDADLANNTFGWQWAAGSGADAAPYFRIFNPVLQGKKFDPYGAYVRQWVPELSKLDAKWIHSPWSAPEAVLTDAGIKLGRDYPFPIVDHKIARERALAALKTLQQSSQ